MGEPRYFFFHVEVSPSDFMKLKKMFKSENAQAFRRLITLGRQQTLEGMVDCDDKTLDKLRAKAELWKEVLNMLEDIDTYVQHEQPKKETSNG